MTRKRVLTTALISVLGGAGVLIPAAASSAKKSKKPAPRTVKISDDFYSVKKLSIKKGTEVKWLWNMDNLDSHNVTLIKGPKGIKAAAWTSVTGASGIKFNRTFSKPGTYMFHCTIHPLSMKMTVVVKG